MASLITHFLTTRRNDFVEMALHHIVTIYLYSGCYLMNSMDIGAVIVFLHDIADITTPFCKTLSETIYKKMTIAFFITNAVVWGYTRNFVFPWIIYNILFNIKDDFNGEPLMRPYFAFLLSCLALLHIYWMYLMFKLLYVYATSGSTEDQ